MPRTAASRMVSILLLCAGAAVSLLAPQAAAARAKPAFPTVLAAEARSKSLCESEPHRVHVATRWGTECVAYFVTEGAEKRNDAVVFIDGDVAVERFSDPAKLEEGLATTRAFLQRWANALGVRYIHVSRLGVHGSSGNHGERRRPKETMILNAALDLIKERLGLERLALAGQSGGSTIAASMLSLGRKDVACAVLGSGAFELVDLRHAELRRLGHKVTRNELQNVTFDPASHADAVAKDDRRRILILGDQSDTRTPFDQQLRYAESLKRFGHHAKVVSIDAQGELDHGATIYTIPTAGGCLSGTPDDKLAAANAKLGRSIAAAEIRNAATASGSLALMSAALRRSHKETAFGK